LVRKTCLSLRSNGRQQGERAFSANGLFSRVQNPKESPGQILDLTAGKYPPHDPSHTKRCPDPGEVMQNRKLSEPAPNERYEKRGHKHKENVMHPYDPFDPTPAIKSFFRILKLGVGGMEHSDGFYILHSCCTNSTLFCSVGFFESLISSRSLEIVRCTPAR
jgi:hypothetical protein